eukprot:scaffold21269_cov119-Isochrysis_galbana.AAC.10
MAYPPNSIKASKTYLVVRDLHLHLHNTLVEAHAVGALPPTMREGDIVLLYKKGDSRDPRNYRPITLLQPSRLQNTSQNFGGAHEKNSQQFRIQRTTRFRPQTPNRGDNAPLEKLVQAYLEEEGRDGLLLALDWEKAFDRVSWLGLLPPSPRSA